MPKLRRLAVCSITRHLFPLLAHDHADEPFAEGDEVTLFTYYCSGCGRRRRFDYPLWKNRVYKACKCGSRTLSQQPRPKKPCVGQWKKPGAFRQTRKFVLSLKHAFLDAIALAKKEQP